MREAVTRISDELIYHYKDTGYLVRVMDDAVNMAINVFVRPEIESANAPSQYAVEIVSWRECSWYGSWWARFLRWAIDSSRPRLRKLAKRIIPSPIIWLCYAMEPAQALEYRDLPTDFLGRIQAQKFELVRRGETPSVVLLGGRAMFEILSHPKMTEPEIWMDANFIHGYIFGLELKSSPWLSEDSIVVV